jgi:hypothetical protein
MNLVHALLPYFCNIHFNITLSSTRSFSTWSLSFLFYKYIFVCIFQHTQPHPSHPPWLILLSSEGYKLWALRFAKRRIICFALQTDILNLFNDAFSKCARYKHDRFIFWQWIVKMWKAVVVAWFKILPRILPCATEDNHRQLQSGCSVSWSRFESGTSQILV